LTRPMRPLTVRRGLGGGAAAQPGTVAKTIDPSSDLRFMFSPDTGVVVQRFYPALQNNPAEKA
jgi:hypothetical protein